MCKGIKQVLDPPRLCIPCKFPLKPPTEAMLVLFPKTSDHRVSGTNVPCALIEGSDTGTSVPCTNCEMLRFVFRRDVRLTIVP